MVTSRVFCFVALAVWAFWSQSASAAVSLEDYGMLPRVSQMAISPNAERIAYRLTAADDKDYVRVYSLKDKENVNLFRVDQMDPQQLQFSGNDNLVLVATQHVSSRRFVHDFDAGTAYGYNIKSNKVRPLIRLGEAMAGKRRIYPAQSIGNVIGTGKGGAEVYVSAYVADSDTDQSPRYSLLRVKANGKGKPSIVVAGNDSVTNYFLGIDSQPIARVERNQRTNTHTVRAYDGSDWTKIYGYKAEIATHSFLGLTGDFSALVFLRRDEDDLRYYTLSLADGKIGQLVNREIKKDISRVLYDSRRVVVGVQYAGLTPSYEMFDDRLDERVQGILSTFPDHAVYLSDWSPDLAHILVRVEGPQYAGDYVLFSSGKKPEWLAGMRPGISREDINPISVIQIKARDGLGFPAILTIPRTRVDSLKDIPTVMLPHGGPAAQDVAGFDFMAQALATHGYLVVQPQFRGSTGLGREHFEAGHGEWGRKMQDDLTDTLNYLVDGNVSDPQRVCIVGASYGGYAALAGAAFTPDLYRCALSIAGVSHLPEMLKTDKSRYGKSHEVLQYLERSILDGDTSSDALKEISPFYSADQVKIPVLLMHGEDDTVVEFAQSRMMYRALKKAGKQVELVRLKDEDHYLTEGSTRLQALQVMLAFIDKNIGQAD